MTLLSRSSRRIANSPQYKWWAYFAIATGMWLTVMDQSGVNIALPRIAEHFDADIPTVQWITLGYVLSTSAMLMPMGRLSDMIGRKRVYMSGMVVFMGAAALGGGAQVFALLIVAKVIQGIGAAAVQANGMAVITEAFPERERGKALGSYMTIIGTGSVSGPLIGGLLVSGLGWRSVFFASVAFGVVTLIAGQVVLRGGRPAQARGSAKVRFDWMGAGLSSAALIIFLLGMTNAHRLGWASPAIVAAFAAAPALLVAFVLWERRASDPMLDLSLFRIKVFSLGVSARFLSFLGGSAVFFLMPFYLIHGLGYAASWAALIMVPGAIFMAVMGPISGRISDKTGTRWLSVMGMGLSTMAMFIFAMLTVDSPAIHVVLGMVLSGAGMGAFSATNSSAIMGSLRGQRIGIVSAFIGLTRTSANVTGIALATTIVSITMASLGYEPSLAEVGEVGGKGLKAAFVSGMSRAFLVSASLSLLALVLTGLRGEVQPAHRPAPGPARGSASSPSSTTEE